MSTRRPPFALSHSRLKPSSLAKETDVLAGMEEEEMCTIDLPEVRTDVSIVPENVRAVASFSWQSSTTPTIMVPGVPRIWDTQVEDSLSKAPIKVLKDTGSEFVDQTGHRSPEYPLASLVQSVHHMEPEFDFGDVDIVTDRNNLRKILRWIAAGGSTSGAKDWRFDIDVAGGRTLLFTRRELHTTETAHRGYGFNFERKFTKPAPGTGYHRVVTYTLDGLKMLVRFESDAALPEKPTSSSRNVDDLLASFSKMNVKPSPSEPSPPGPIKVIPSGAFVAQDRIVEMTTISSQYLHTFRWEEIYPQLLLSQTPHLFVGLHQFGTFSEIRRHRLDSPDEPIKSAREKMEDSLRRLVDVLHTVHELVVGSYAEKKLALACKAGKVGLYERTDRKDALPEELLKLFE